MYQKNDYDNERRIEEWKPIKRKVIILNDRRQTNLELNYNKVYININVNVFCGCAFKSK